MDAQNSDALQALVEEDGAELDRAEADAAEEADFVAGFGDQEGSEEAARRAAAPLEGEDDEQAPAAEPATPPAAEPQAAAGDAPAAPASDGGEDRLAQMEKRLRSVEGRNGALNAELKAAKEQLAKLTASKPASKQPTAAEMLAASMAGGSKLKALQSEFPEFAEALEEQARLVSEVIDRRVGAAREMLEADGERVSASAVREMVKEARQLAQLDIKHPGWEQTCSSQDFAQWFQVQDDGTKALASSDSAADAMKLIDRYEEARKAKSIQAGGSDAQRGGGRSSTQRRLESAIPATNGASGSPARQQSEEEDFLAGYRSARGE